MQDAVKQAKALAQAGKWAEADALLVQKLTEAPTHIEALHLAASIAEYRGDLQRAAMFLRRAADAHPRVFHVQAHLSSVLRELNDFTGAIAFGERALALRPKDAAVLNDIAIACVGAGDVTRAEALARQALALQPEMAQPHNTLGLLAMQAGRMDEAVAHFETSLARKPSDTAALVNVISARTVQSADDPRLKEIEALIASPGTSERERMSLLFGASKAYADLKQNEDSLKAAIQACAIKRRSISYNEAATFRHFDDIKRTFSRDLLSSMSGHGFRDPTPIFIISMPRAGSTLTEQILASHPSVYGAGELVDFSDAVDASLGGPNGLQSFLERPNASLLPRIGQEYVARLRRRSDAEHVTDKMPSNYFTAGLIHLALPDAKIIHVTRNPVDTCVSCFTKLFPEGLPHTYELGELGRYYRSYHALMAHWREVLPPHALLDVRYEDVVNDIEGQARRLLDFCGLAWDPAVLSFHENERRVKTHSVAQVRQPLYRSALGRWEGQRHLLQPLLDALGDLAPS